MYLSLCWDVLGRSIDSPATSPTWLDPGYLWVLHPHLCHPEASTISMIGWMLWPSEVFSAGGVSASAVTAESRNMADPEAGEAAAGTPRHEQTISGGPCTLAQMQSHLSAPSKDASSRRATVY